MTSPLDEFLSAVFCLAILLLALRSIGKGWIAIMTILIERNIGSKDL